MLEREREWEREKIGELFRVLVRKVKYESYVESAPGYRIMFGTGKIQSTRVRMTVHTTVHDCCSKMK